MICPMCGAEIEDICRWPNLEREMELHIECGCLKCRHRWSYINRDEWNAAVQRDQEKS